MMKNENQDNRGDAFHPMPEYHSGSSEPLTGTRLGTPFQATNGSAQPQRASFLSLSIETRANQPIEWYTNAIQRMMLEQTNTAILNGFPGIVQDGFLSISEQPLFFSNTAGPFSRIHLVDGTNANPIVYAQQFGYRPWMRNGITLTGNSDQAYLGHKYNGNDTSDVVLQWSDNPYDAPWSTDRLKFIFTNAYDNSKTYGARSLHGLETFRIFIPNDTSGFVGIGDFNRATVQAGSLVDPAERLDILDSTIRLRDFSPVSNTTYLNQGDEVDRVLVADENDGTVYWRPMSDFAGQTDCDFEIDGNGNVRTAWNPSASTGCPSDANSLFLGVSAGTAKLHVLNDEAITNRGTGVVIDHKPTSSGQHVGTEIFLAPTAADPKGDQHYALDVLSRNGEQLTSGIRATAEVSDANITSATVQGIRSDAAVSYGQANNQYGVYSLANVGTSGSITNNYGVYCHAQLGQVNHGVHGRAVGVDPTRTNIGVYGYTNTGYANNWAGWFQGNVMINGNGFLTGMVPITSDAALKTNVQDLTNGNQIINALQPKTYDFLTTDHPTIGLSDRPQLGLIAQEVEQVLPDLVSEVTIPAELDSLGNVVHPAETIKALNYMGLIPVLISAVKEQQAVNDQLTQRGPNGTGPGPMLCVA